MLQANLQGASFEGQPGDWPCLDSQMISKKSVAANFAQESIRKFAAARCFLMEVSVAMFAAFGCFFGRVLIRI